MILLVKKTAMPKFSALEKLRKEKHKFEASLIYMSSKNLLDRATRKKIKEVKYIWLTLL